MRTKLLSGLFVALAVSFVLSCKKKSDEEDNKYTCSTCKTTPDAVAAHDANSKGIYKGVIIGSSGTIKFDIANGGNAITATMVIDGINVNLSSNVTWVAGQAYTSAFTGTLNGSQVSVNFTVAADGQGATITSSNIPGHANATFTLSKETSTALIECYEGTYSSSKPENGTFNLVLSRSLKKYGGVSRVNGSSSSSRFSGTINSSNGLLNETGSLIATLSGDEIKGSFNDSNGKSVTVNGKRTL